MAWYRTGTITTTNGSTTITGAGTNFISQRAGWMLCIPSTGAIHEIAEIISSTELRTSEPIASAGAAGQAYFIVPTQGLALTLSEKVGELITLFNSTRDTWQAVYTDFSQTTYQLWLDQGNAGTILDFLDTLVGATGPTGASAYEHWLAAGNTGTEADFLNWVSGNAIVQAGAARDAAQTAETGAVAAQGASETARDASLAAQTASETARDAAQGHAAQVAADLAAVAAIFDSFDDRYLGKYDTDPVTDNDGDPLIPGTMYWNEPAGELRFYNGVGWDSPDASAAASAQQALDAKAAALVAQAAAEAARDAALAAQTAAETARDQAVIAQGASETARDASVVAQGASETARDAASASATAANTAKVAAETARDAAATSETNAGTSATAAVNAQAGAEAAQTASETARDDAQAHANAASLASNATKWAANGNYVEGQLLWSPINGVTYRSLTNHSGSAVDPSLDDVNFIEAAGADSLSKTQNLADLESAEQAQINLGLGSAATLDAEQVHKAARLAAALPIIFGS